MVNKWKKKTSDKNYNVRRAEELVWNWRIAHKYKKKTEKWGMTETEMGLWVVFIEYIFQKVYAACWATYPTKIISVTVGMINALSKTFMANKPTHPRRRKPAELINECLYYILYIFFILYGKSWNIGHSELKKKLLSL